MTSQVSVPIARGPPEPWGIPADRSWMAGRTPRCCAAPALAGTEVWGLHTIASALRGLVAHLEGRQLSETAPTSHHSQPVDAARCARKAMEEATERLAHLGAAVEYEESRPRK